MQSVFIRRSRGRELEDETRGADATGNEEGDEDEEGGEDGEPREKKPRGHRYEDKEAKNVGKTVHAIPA